nr:hypothetical protein [uncultured Acetatifactor sp.]
MLSRRKPFPFLSITKMPREGRTPGVSEAENVRLYECPAVLERQDLQSVSFRWRKTCVDDIEIVIA